MYLVTEGPHLLVYILLQCQTLILNGKPLIQEILAIAEQLGRHLATWQSISPVGFGPFDAIKLKNEGKLIGLHSSYPYYFRLNLEKHLHYLVDNEFLSALEARSLLNVIETNTPYLQLEKSCLVHKDLALWNILGDASTIHSFIDWDDTIAGDPTDDLSLLACFYSDDIIEAALKGYVSVKALPGNFIPRFYLHLLRNMIVKAVIRVAGNYFNRSDDFFLIDTGSIGNLLKEITRERIFLASGMLQKKSEKIAL